jgi:hypothetical protein
LKQGHDGITLPGQQRSSVMEWSAAYRHSRQLKQLTVVGMVFTQKMHLALG